MSDSNPELQDFQALAIIYLTIKVVHNLYVWKRLRFDPLDQQNIILIQQTSFSSLMNLGYSWLIFDIAIKTYYLENFYIPLIISGVSLIVDYPLLIKLWVKEQYVPSMFCFESAKRLVILQIIEFIITLVFMIAMNFVPQIKWGHTIFTLNLVPSIYRCQRLKIRPIFLLTEPINQVGIIVYLFFFFDDDGSKTVLGVENDEPFILANMIIIIILVGSLFYQSKRIPAQQLFNPNPSEELGQLNSQNKYFKIIELMQELSKDYQINDNSLTLLEILKKLAENNEFSYECTICLEMLLGFKEENEIYKISYQIARIGCTPCKHLFHIDCIQQWVRTHPSCPNCRSNL